MLEVSKQSSKSQILKQVSIKTTGWVFIEVFIFFSLSISAHASYGKENIYISRVFYKICHVPIIHYGIKKLRTPTFF